MSTGPGATPSDDALPVIDFATFVLSLSQSVVMHLGDVPNPETEKLETNLVLARQTIDLLGLLEEKTKGNLTGDEERLLTHVLFDLRMRFVEAEKKSAPKKRACVTPVASSSFSEWPWRWRRPAASACRGAPRGGATTSPRGPCRSRARRRPRPSRRRRPRWS